MGAAYAVDNAGNRTSRTPQPSGTASNYAYDNIYELTGVTQNSTTTESYTYDAVGNRLSSLGVSPFVNNTSNELTSTPSTTYTYDNNGNTLTKVVGSNTTSYAWDFENRMTSVTLPGSGGTISFKYDPFGHRIYKSSSAGTSIYAYDGDDLIEETNATGGVVARYTQTTDKIDEPVAMLRSGATTYYQADGLGSITSLSSTAGALAQTYTFDSFGKQTASSGSLTNPFQYTAREFDVETSLYNFRARYYDPNPGRFLSEDPIDFSGGINFYAYVGNNPLVYVDPDGTEQDDASRATYAEAGSFAVNHLGPPQDLSAPAGLADLKASVGAVCQRNHCEHSQPGPHDRPGNIAAWNNILNANGGQDRTGGGNFMCVGQQGCWWVHAVFTCVNCHPKKVPRPTPLAPSGSVTLNGNTVYFYKDPLQGWDCEKNRNSGCKCKAKRRRK
jgi:RHS repeat-associated protein